MRLIPDPGRGRKWNRAHPPKKDDRIYVTTSHEERLLTAYPSLQGELDRLKRLPVPASFLIPPGKVTGDTLTQVSLWRARQRGQGSHGGPAPAAPGPEPEDEPAPAAGPGRVDTAVAEPPLPSGGDPHGER